MSSPDRDRVGLAWRDELATQIYLNLDRIEHVEVLAEREFTAPRQRLASLRALAREVPLSIHGVSLGMASSADVPADRLSRMARLVDRIAPNHWSEHLAFVRAGGIEIGHLAAAPYSPQTAAGALRNLERARRIVGAPPHMENIATLLMPPGSPWSECEFVSAIVASAGTPMLLDLHNLYANARNFGSDPFSMLASMPLAHVSTVHISGGHWAQDGSGKPHLIDDHVHDPPDVVFELLESLARRAPRSLTVIIERDGRYPDFGVLLDQMTRARLAVAAGRAQCRQAAMTRVA